MRGLASLQNEATTSEYAYPQTGVMMMPRMSIPFSLVPIAAACLLLVAGPLLAAPLSVSGRVLGPDGEPVAGATAFVSSFSTEGRFEVSTGTTDGAGAFSFSVDDAAPLQPATVAAMKPGFALAWTLVNGGEQADLQLSPHTVTCRGVCVDGSGTPLPGATVSVVEITRAYENHWSQYERRLSFAPESPIRVTTDAAGAFAIPDLPVGATLSLEAVAAGCEKRKRGQIPADAEGIRIHLRPEATVSGSVTHEGAGVAGVSVNLSLWTSSIGAETVADGSFTLTGISPGRYALQLRGAPEGLVADWVPRVELRAGQTLPGINIPLVPSATVPITFADGATGAPVEGVELYARMTKYPPGAMRDWCVWSDARGRCQLRTPAGELELYPRTRIGETPLWSISPSEKMLTVETGQTHDGVDFTVTMHPKVTGSVIGPDGNPVAGAEVGTVNRMGYFDVPPREFFCTRSAADGTFAMQVFASRAMQEGNARLFAIARDASRGLAGLAAPEGLDGPIEIHLQPGAWLLTRVVNRDGEPMPGVPIGVKMGEFGEAAQFERTMPGGVSDAQGFVRVGPIAPDADCAIEMGQALRRFFVNESEVGAELFRLAPGEERQLLPIVFDPRGRSVTGTVLDAQGQPVRDALVFGDSTVVPAIADEDGEFTLTGLPKDGMVTLQAVHPTESLFAGTEVDPDAAPPLTLTLGPPAGVAGRALDADGNPVPGMMLIHDQTNIPPVIGMELECRQQEAGREVYEYVNEDGTWRMSGFVPGIDCTFVLYDRKGEFRRQELTFTAEPGVTTDLGDIILERK